MKKFVALNCPACGGPLRVEITSKDAECNFCQAQTKLRNIDGVFELHLVSTLEDAQDQLRDEVRVIRVQNAIRTLDNRWENAVEQLMSDSSVRFRGPDGQDVSADGAVGCGIAAIIAVAAIPLGITATFFFRENTVVAWICGANMIVALLLAIYGIGKYYRLLVQRDKMHAVYMARRNRLLKRLQKAKLLADA